ncbi:MAG TPA: hypothetical protein VNB24_01930 [Acidimicrobiales bacterium]|nr:hypothetical protein [Acidimicrobiales bacterium]
MPYTAERPAQRETPDQLRARIPGWGADADPKDRPSVPREQLDSKATGAHWEFPDRQPEQWPRERSVEHSMLTPVFGTSCPPKGLSGILRKFAYLRYSEARATHWLLLVAADRIDALESHVGSLLRGRPDPMVATGLRSEFAHHGMSSRLHQNRVDVGHQLLDPLVVAVPKLATGAAIFAIGRAALRTAKRFRAA